MEELAKLTVWDKAVICLVSQAGTVRRQLVVLGIGKNEVYGIVKLKLYFWWNVDNPLLAGWVKDLVSVGFVLPGHRPVLLPLASHPVVEGEDGVWEDIPPGEQTLFCTRYRRLADFYHRGLVRIWHQG